MDTGDAEDTGRIVDGTAGGACAKRPTAETTGVAARSDPDGSVAVAGDRGTVGTAILATRAGRPGAGA